MKKFLVLMIGLIWFFGGCEKKDTEDRIKNIKIVTIGAILPLTGPVSEFGNWIKQGMKLASNEINKKQKKLQIDIIYEDSKFDSKTGILAFNKLQKINHVDICYTAMSKVAIPIIKNNKNKMMPIILQDVTYPNITEFDRTVFRHFIQSDREAEIMSNFILEKNITKLSVIYVNDEAGIGAKNKIEETLKNIISNEVAFLSNSSDLKSIVLKSMKNKPDGIYLYGNGPSWANILKKLKELNYTGTIFTNTAMYIPTFRKIAGNAIENIYFTYPKIGDNERYLKFHKSYFKAYGENPQLEAIYAYDLVTYLFESINNSQNKSIIEALRGNNYFNSLFDNLVIKNRDFITPISIGVMKNNKIKEVY